jgi:hypothetical protein
LFFVALFLHWYAVLSCKSMLFVLFKRGTVPTCYISLVTRRSLPLYMLCVNHLLNNCTLLSSGCDLSLNFSEMCKRWIYWIKEAVVDENTFCRYMATLAGW